MKPLTRAFVPGLMLIFLGSCGSNANSEPTDDSNAPCTEPCDFHETVWVGDILLGDAAQPFLDEFGYEWPFEQVGGLLEADYTIGNAEGPITEISEQYNEDQQFHYNAEPESAGALASVGFDAVGTANNHTLDRGPDGALDTLEHLADAGIEAFGSGRDSNEAGAPRLIETPHGTLGVVAFTEDVAGYGGEDEPGPAILREDSVAAGLERAREAGARWVVAYVHWGENYSGLSRSQLFYSRKLAEAGYDLVIGHHPHVEQGLEFVEGTPVLYSLGNFVFGTPGRFNEDFPGYGLVARTFLGPEGFERIELTCILTDNEVVVFQPELCPEDEAREVIEGLGSDVEWRDGVGVVELR